MNDRQAEYQASAIQLSGNLYGKTSSILSKIGAIECFVDPRIISKLLIRLGNMANSWMVQYGNQVEQRVVHVSIVAS